MHDGTRDQRCSEYQFLSYIDPFVLRVFRQVDLSPKGANGTIHGVNDTSRGPKWLENGWNEKGLIKDRRHLNTKILYLRQPLF